MSPTHLEVEPLLASMTDSLSQYLSARAIDDPLFIGIRSGGIWIAQKLHQSLALTSPLGSLDISFYRDDFTRIGLHPNVQPSDIPCAVQDRHLVLVDDVIMTGRTIRAALNEIFDYGRPASVTLAALVDLERRELPIRADVTGQTLKLDADQQVKLTGPEPLSLIISRRSTGGSQ
ncbi:MAG: bifunctional pyr operon transcriptional regulator/uracil phosphoribosyltransferase PyrR [Pseudomonadales bacterium]